MNKLVSYLAMIPPAVVGLACSSGAGVDSLSQNSSDTTTESKTSELLLLDSFDDPPAERWAIDEGAGIQHVASSEGQHISFDSMADQCITRRLDPSVYNASVDYIWGELTFDYELSPGATIEYMIETQSGEQRFESVTLAEMDQTMTERQTASYTFWGPPVSIQICFSGRGMLDEVQVATPVALYERFDRRPQAPWTISKEDCQTPVDDPANPGVYEHQGIWYRADSGGRCLENTSFETSGRFPMHMFLAYSTDEKASVKYALRVDGDWTPFVSLENTASQGSSPGATYNEDIEFSLEEHDGKTISGIRILLSGDSETRDAARVGLLGITRADTDFQPI